MERCRVVRDVLDALQVITGGRLVCGAEDLSGNNHFVVTKTSDIPGKAVTELPGLIWGSPDRPVRRVAVLMTLTENAIELAAATNADCLVAHHPVADGANAGGVTIRNYFDLYGLSLIEVHEAFHGLHPGIPWLHGHRPFRVEIAYGGVPGNVLFVGDPLPEVRTLGDVVQRLDHLMGVNLYCELADYERTLRHCDDMGDVCSCAKGQILLGTPETPLGKVLHIFPHTGFSPENLRKAREEHPEVNTVIASISRILPGSPLLVAARELGLNVVCGNTHAMEIYESGLPLAVALQDLLPDLDIRIFRERTTSIPVSGFGSEEMRRYGERMAREHLERRNAAPGR